MTKMNRTKLAIVGVTAMISFSAVAFATDDGKEFTVIQQLGSQNLDYGRVPVDYRDALREFHERVEERFGHRDLQRAYYSHKRNHRAKLSFS